MQTRFSKEIERIDSYLHSLLTTDAACPLPHLERFWQSLSYSLFSPGKRFRPLLSLLTAQALEKSESAVMPMAAAVELIHTYSLIHDDLPCMDDDDLRRGLPTNHKVYGEPMALLAGDGLLTLAFYVLARSPSAQTVKAVQLLAEAAGIHGMVGGQVLDISGIDLDRQLLGEIHARKTGALIQVSVEGAALLCEATLTQHNALKAYGHNLGLAFQLADDVQDFDPAQPEKVSFVSKLGLEETRKLLSQVTENATASLKIFGESATGLREMVDANLKRI